MKDIKFRAFDNALSCGMSECFELGSFLKYNDLWFGGRVMFKKDGNDVLVPLSDCAIMQFTGIKNVYEGDIIKYQHSENSKEYIGEVIYKDDFASFWIKTSNDSGFALLGQQKIIEVIGNIYQNPELLQK